jgi:hypothetical protein
MSSEEEAKKPKSVRATFHIPEDLLEHYRNAAWWERESVSGLVEKAMEEFLDKLEERNGGRYEKRRGTIARGKPIQ